MSYKNIFSLEGKHIVLTGANGILGKNFARALSDHGAFLSLIDLNFDEDFTTEMAEKADFYPVDISDKKSLSSAAQLIFSKQKSVDVLFSNAATKGKEIDRFFDPLEDFSTDVWREIMSVNLDAMFLVCQIFGSKMARQGYGSIILTGSIYGLFSPDQRIYQGSLYEGKAINSPAVYSASKAGVLGLSNYLAGYWGKNNIRVNTLVPGGIESGQNDVFYEKYSARVPLNRMGKIDDLMGAVIFLASDASSYVSGQALVIDGGLSVW